MVFNLIQASSAYPRAMLMSQPFLLTHFSALQDPRQSWKAVYPLEEILLIILSGVMAGADDFVQIGLWAKTKLDFLQRFLPFAHGVPSYDTTNDVMNALPNDVFVECFTAWVKAFGQHDQGIVAMVHQPEKWYPLFGRVGYTYWP